MDIKEYIASGIIENYVFNSVTDQERREVECMSQIYPEIKADLVNYQNAIEKLATKSAEQPPAALKARILKALAITKQDIAPIQTKTAAKVIPLNQSNYTTQQKSGGALKFLAAASIMALIGVGAYTFFLKNDLNAANQNLAETNQQLNTTKNTLATQVEENGSLNTVVNELDNQMAFLLDENTAKIQLAGTPAFNDNIATVFWNKETKATYLDAKNLKPTGADESYQLWVLVEGEPINKGIINSAIKNDSLIKMEQTASADAFAITLEPLGGSKSPSLDKLVVIGNI